LLGGGVTFTDRAIQPTARAVSSITNEVGSELSSTLVNLSVTVWPWNYWRRTTCWTYPAARIQVGVVEAFQRRAGGLSTCSHNASHAVVVAVSVVSMCSQKVNLAVVADAGMVTV